MKFSRRRLLQLALGAAAPAVVVRRASAEGYPSRPVHILFGFPPGGNDVFARLIGQWLSVRLGQSFVVDNRPGAASNIATEIAVRSAPDGYTLLFFGTASAINAALYDKLNFDFTRDIAPVAGIARVPLVLEVHPSVPAKTVSELIAYTKANPGKLNYASPGNGTVPHVAGELFKMMAGVEMAHVPFRGDAPAMTALLGGQVQVYLGTLSGSIAHIRSGEIRALAVTTRTRVEVLPELPPVNDVLPGFEASVWFGIGAPKDTPVDIVGKLNSEVNAGLADPKMKAKFADLGGDALAMAPADFGALIAQETAKWGKVIRTTGIRID